MSLSGEGDQVARAVRFIAGHSRVGWLAELHGSFSIGVALAVTYPKQADAFLKELVSESGVRVYKKSFAFRLSLMDCPRHYLGRRTVSRATHCIEDGVEAVSIDSIDVDILRALTAYPDSSIRELGARVGIPHTTVDLRLRKLRASRVLLGHSTHVSLEKLGRQLHKLLVFTRAKSEKVSQEMKRFAVNHPLVSHYIENVGEWDFEFNVEVESLAQLQEFETQLRHRFDPLIDDVQSLGISKVHSLRRFAGGSISER
jgi:DNA-binding Lrp family transcriptional regulator